GIAGKVKGLIRSLLDRLKGETPGREAGASGKHLQKRSREAARGAFKRPMLAGLPASLFSSKTASTASMEEAEDQEPQLAGVGPAKKGLIALALFLPLLFIFMRRKRRKALVIVAALLLAQPLQAEDELPAHLQGWSMGTDPSTLSARDRQTIIDIVER